MQLHSFIEVAASSSIWRYLVFQELVSQISRWYNQAAELPALYTTMNGLVEINCQPLIKAVQVPLKQIHEQLMDGFLKNLLDEWRTLLNRVQPLTRVSETQQGAAVLKEAAPMLETEGHMKALMSVKHCLVILAVQVMN